jgi:hypothetical protein
MIEDHFRSPQPAQSGGPHDDIQVEVLLVALVSGRDLCGLEKFAMDRHGWPTVAYMFSRWELRQRYRKVISVGSFDASYAGSEPKAGR